MTHTTSIHSDLYQSDELNVFNRYERKAWTKPEIREINFNKTASGGMNDEDAMTKS